MGLEGLLGWCRENTRNKVIVFSTAALIGMGGIWAGSKIKTGGTASKAFPEGFEFSFGMSEDAVKNYRPFAKGSFPAKEDLGEAAKERVREFLFGIEDTPPNVSPAEVEYYFKDGKLGGVAFSGKKFYDGDCTLTGERVLARVKEEKGGAVMGKSKKEFILYKDVGDSFAIYSFSSGIRDECRFRYNVLQKTFMKPEDLKLLGGVVAEEISLEEQRKVTINQYVAEWKGRKTVEERYQGARRMFDIEEDIATVFGDDMLVEVGWIKQGKKLYVDGELSDRTQTAIKYVHSLFGQRDELLEPEERNVKEVLLERGAIYLGRAEEGCFFALDSGSKVEELLVKMDERDKVQGLYWVDK